MRRPRNASSDDDDEDEDDEEEEEDIGEENLITVWSQGRNDLEGVAPTHRRLQAQRISLEDISLEDTFGC
jgi:hypothetical protein